MLPEELTGGTGALSVSTGRARRLAGLTHILSFLLRGGCAAAAAWYAAIYAWIVWSRIGYPFDLEWMEGAMVDHVRFLLQHGNLYVAPSLAFVPYVYNPFYYVIAAAVTLVTGEGYLPLRLVSVAGSLASTALIAWMVARETRHREIGILCGGFFLATYALSGGWFDIARVDSLHFAFVLASIACVRFAQRPRHHVAAAVFTWLAFETKQSGAGIAVPLALYLLLAEGWVVAAWYAAPCAALIGGSILVLNLLSHGWYWLYAFSLTQQLASHYGRSVWRTELFGNFPFALALAFFFFAMPRSAAGKTKLFYALVAAALFGIAVAVRAHSGSWLNDNITAHGALAILMGLGSAALLASEGERKAGAAALAYGTLLAQFLFIVYNPGPWIPTPADRREGERLEALVRSTPGEVLLTHRGYLTRRNGKGEHAHQMAVVNMLMIPDDRLGARSRLTEEFTRALHEKRFALILTDWDDFPFTEALKESYDAAAPAYIRDPKAFYCPTGARLKPVFAYVPK